MKSIKKFLQLTFLVMSFVIFTSCLKGDGGSSDVSNELRIVSLVPSNTEILVGLDLGDKIVGADEYSKDVSGINTSAEIFEIGDPNMEALLKLNPTHVLISGHSSDASKYTELENAGAEIINIETAKSIQEIYDSINLIGENLNKADEANKMVEELKKQVDSLSSNLEGQKVSVYFEISQAPYLYSFGKDTYLNEMIEISGGENIFKDLDSWIAPSEEAIIKANPEIIFTNVDVEGNIEEIKNRAGWENIDAVKNNRVYYIDKDESSRPSQFFLGALEEISQYIREYSNEG